MRPTKTRKSNKTRAHNSKKTKKDDDDNIRLVNDEAHNSSAVIKDSVYNSGGDIAFQGRNMGFYKNLIILNHFNTTPDSGNASTSASSTSSTSSSSDPKPPESNNWSSIPLDSFRTLEPILKKLNVKNTARSTKGSKLCSSCKGN